MYTVLVCDDDKEIVEAIEIYLSQEGYQILKAYDGEQALKVLSEEKVDLLVIDVMMPRLDGIRATLKIREKLSLPIIILSAKSEDSDKILGLNIGADDYVTKPFSMKILLKKIRVMLKLVSEEQDSVFDDGYLKVDLSKAQVEVNGKLCSLTPTEFKLLQVFLEHRRQLLTYNILLERLWDCDGQFVDKHTLVVNVNRLRGKIEDGQHKYISNVYGMGYQWLDLS